MSTSMNDEWLERIYGQLAAMKALLECEAGIHRSGVETLQTCVAQFAEGVASSPSANCTETDKTMTRLLPHEAVQVLDGLSGASARLGRAIHGLAGASSQNTRTFRQLCEIRENIDSILEGLRPTILLEEESAQ